MVYGVRGRSQVVYTHSNGHVHQMQAGFRHHADGPPLGSTCTITGARRENDRLDHRCRRWRGDIILEIVRNNRLQRVPAVSRRANEAPAQTAGRGQFTSRHGGWLLALLSACCSIVPYANSHPGECLHFNRKCSWLIDQQPNRNLLPVPPHRPRPAGGFGGRARPVGT